MKLSLSLVRSAGLVMAAMLFLLLASSFMSVPVASAHALSGGINGTWKIAANASTGTMTLNVDANGNVTGTVFGNALIGSYDSSTGHLAFVRYIAPSYVQSYSGSLTSAGNLEGHFQEFHGPDQQGGSPTYAWIASRG
jgi:hypothetical protein